jgi:hypothetical protein
VSRLARTASGHLYVRVVLRYINESTIYEHTRTSVRRFVALVVGFLDNRETAGFAPARADTFLSRARRTEERLKGTQSPRREQSRERGGARGGGMDGQGGEDEITRFQKSFHLSWPRARNSACTSSRPLRRPACTFAHGQRRRFV